MAEQLFTRALIQAVNDWQRGGDHTQKVRRAERLKQCAAALPAPFRQCDAPCFRQEAHEIDRVWQLLANNQLPETIAAWTTDIGIAKSFKGGVPPPGLQGVIFKIIPPPESVVLNLTTLYADPAFRAAVQANKPDINGYADGINRWDDSQHEVVLELGNLDQARILSYGGFSSNKETLVEQYLQRKPTPEDIAEFDRLAAVAGVTPGEWWLSESGTKAVLNRMQPRIDEMKKKKAREQAAC